FSSYDSLLGVSTFSGLDINTATCPSDPSTLGGAGLTSITSGWFKVPLCAPPTDKCRHGVDVVCPTGLNKDRPGRPNYDAAYNLAVMATTAYVDQILNDSSVAGNAKAIRALFGLKGSMLGMVIDDTGSMGGVIDQVKAQVAQIVNSLLGTNDEPANYLLERFGDPDIGP